MMRGAMWRRDVGGVPSGVVSVSGNCFMFVLKLDTLYVFSEWCHFDVIRLNR